MRMIEDYASIAPYETAFRLAECGFMEAACPCSITAAAKRAAACLVRGQRGLPLSRPGFRGAAVSGRRRVRRRLDAHRVCGADLRAVHPSVARPSRRPTGARGCCSWRSASALAAMNSSFYLALDRLPMSLVAAMEFVGTILIALYGLRSGRNLLALALAARACSS